MMQYCIVGGVSHAEVCMHFLYGCQLLSLLSLTIFSDLDCSEMEGQATTSTP